MVLYDKVAHWICLWLDSINEYQKRASFLLSVFSLLLALELGVPVCGLYALAYAERHAVMCPLYTLPHLRDSPFTTAAPCPRPLQRLDRE